MRAMMPSWLILEGLDTLRVGIRARRWWLMDSREETEEDIRWSGRGGDYVLGFASHPRLGGKSR